MLKLCDKTLNNSQANHSLWESTLWHQAKVCCSSGLGFRNLLKSHPEMN